MGRISYFFSYANPKQPEKCLKKKYIPQAVEVLDQYYKAMNERNPEGMQACVSDNVEVFFLDESKNWEGSDVALTKFKMMFEKSPDFECKSKTIVNESTERRFS